MSGRVYPMSSCNSVLSSLQWNSDWYMPLLKVSYTHHPDENRVRLVPLLGLPMEVRNEDIPSTNRLEEGYIGYRSCGEDFGHPFSSSRILNYVDFPSEKYGTTHYAIYDTNLAEKFDAEVYTDVTGKKFFIIGRRDLPLVKTFRVEIPVQQETLAQKLFNFSLIYNYDIIDWRSNSVKRNRQYSVATPSLSVLTWLNEDALPPAPVPHEERKFKWSEPFDWAFENEKFAKKRFK